MTGWWFGTRILWLSIQLGISSSQLTNSIIFQRGKSTTNQIWFDDFFRLIFEATVGVPWRQDGQKRPKPGEVGSSVYGAMVWTMPRIIGDDAFSIPSVDEQIFISLVHSLTHFGIFSNPRFHHFLLLQFQKIRGLSGVSHQVLVGGSRCLARSPPAPRRPGPTPPRRNRSRRHRRNRRRNRRRRWRRGRPSRRRGTGRRPRRARPRRPRPRRWWRRRCPGRQRCPCRIRRNEGIAWDTWTSFGFHLVSLMLWGKLQGPVSINSEGVDAPRMLGWFWGDTFLNVLDRELRSVGLPSQLHHRISSAVGRSLNELLDAQQKDGMDLGATDELERNLVKQKSLRMEEFNMEHEHCNILEYIGMENLCPNIHQPPW